MRQWRVLRFNDSTMEASRRFLDVQGGLRKCLGRAWGSMCARLLNGGEGFFL